GCDVPVRREPLARHFDSLDAEADGRELALDQPHDRIAGGDDRLAGLIESHRDDENHHGGDHPDNDPPVQDPRMTYADDSLAANVADGDGKLAGIDGLRGSEVLGAYLLQLASSTIQATSSSNECPAWRACSGTSDVSVMPGWVLISRQTSSPSSPAKSLKRKSVRDTPRHPSAACALSAIFCTLS